MRVTFDKITAPASVTFKCVGCGKRRTRKQTFWATANPFNRHKNGRPKTPAEVRADVQAEARAWEKSTKTCATCERAA